MDKHGMEVGMEGWGVVGMIGSFFIGRSQTEIPH